MKKGTALILALGSICMLSLSGQGVSANQRLVPATQAHSNIPQHSRQSLLSLPIGAQAVVSATLGRADRLYRVAAKDGELSAQNQSQALLADFNQHGMRVRTKGGTHWGMALQGYGYGDRLESVGEATPQGEANRVEYRHPSLVEWYVNGPAGLEQGFTLTAPPPGALSRASKASHANSSPLTIALRLGGDLTAATDSSAAGPSVTRAQALTLRDRGGHAVLRYTGLNAHDANGRELVAWLELSGQEMRLRVDDAGAHYPLVVDPFIQVAKLTASDGEADDDLGQSVSVNHDGSIVVAGAPEADCAEGEAYVFVRPPAGWASATESARLSSSDGGAGDEFGWSVGVSSDGNTIIVGALTAGPGAAYVFAKPAGGWKTATETAKLTASNGVVGDQLGRTVSISGDGSAIVVGAVGTNSFQGAAYVFVKPIGGWATATETAKLTASNGVLGDRLGLSVSISGDGSAIVVGAVGLNFGQGAAYVFVKPIGGWATATQTAELTASDESNSLGYSVSASGDGGVIAAGAPFTSVNSVRNQGEAYVFVKPIGGWATATETGKLTASDGAAGDFFGNSVSVSSDSGTIIAGSPETASNPAAPGAVYIFVKPVSGWATGTQTAELTASDGQPNDAFGAFVSISGDASTIVAAAPQANSEQGAAYVFAQPVSPMLGADAQRFGLLANETINLARSTTISFVNQSPAAPEVGADTANIAGPTSQLGGDLIAEVATGTAISLGAHDTVVGVCATGGGSLALGTGAACGSISTDGTSTLLTTLTNAESEATSYAAYLAGLTTTTTLGNITLKKSQSLTVKLGAGINVVSIGNITTAGSNTITFSAPKSATVVVNVSGALNLGTGTHIFTNTGGLSQHNLIWNIESANPTFGSSVTFNGTLLNEVEGSTTVTFGAGSSVNGAVLTNGDLHAIGAMHLNFWPFTAAPTNPPS